jgi:hypothetical protein
MTTQRRGTAARGAAVLLAGISGFQVLLAAGAPLGRAAYGGGEAELSDLQRMTSGGAALLWAGSAVVVLTFAGEVAGGRYRGSRGLRRVVWLVAGVSGVGAVLNLASSSPWERFGWAPVALATAVLTGIVARTVEPRPLQREPVVSRSR